MRAVWYTFLSFAFTVGLSAGDLRLVAPEITAGRGLQAGGIIRVSGELPSDGLRVTVTSADPGRLLLSADPHKKGQASITLTLAKMRENPEFYFQALADTGVVTYTASAAGVTTSTGTVRLAPSAVALLGPFSKPSFWTTIGRGEARLTLQTMLLDDSRQPVEAQPVAGGSSVVVEIRSSDSKVGTITTPTVTLEGGSARGASGFLPTGVGNAVLSVTVPSGFTTPSVNASVAAKVVQPGIALVENEYLGRNLQMRYSLGLGESAPKGGLDVTLRSNPSELLLSASTNESGSDSLTVHVPAGGMTAQYVVQAVGPTGIFKYSASAPGYLSRTAEIMVAQSGVVIVGPTPMNRSGGPPNPAFSTKLSDGKPTPIEVVTALLIPGSNMASDVTTQTLRPGVSITVNVSAADPKVGIITGSPVSIPGGQGHGLTQFVPKGEGVTAITVSTPEGFTKPSNYQRIEATVRQ